MPWRGADSVVDYGIKLTFVEACSAEKMELDESVQEAASFAAEEQKRAKRGAESVALRMGGIAAVLTGACCVVPRVLVSLGLGGAWLANLQLLAPYKPAFNGIALAALGFAG